METQEKSKVEDRTCFEVSIQECLEHCPHKVSHCDVRLLREIVLNKPEIAELVENALNEHWREAYVQGVRDTSSKLTYTTNI